MRSLLCLVSFFMVLPTFAWRETNNGGGITEQNIVFMTQNLAELTSVLVKDPQSALSIKEQHELKQIVQLIEEQIVLRFENQEHESKSAFEIIENKLWIFTKYLGLYDLNKDDELSWAEVVCLILDAYFRVGSSQFSISEFEVLKSKVVIHFNQRVHQQITMIKADNFLQTTSIADPSGQQKNFLIQVDYSNVISLTLFASSNLSCSQKLDIKRLSNFRVKHTQDDKNKLIFLGAIDVKFVCGGLFEQNSVLLKFALEEKVLRLIDFAIQ